MSKPSPTLVLIWKIAEAEAMRLQHESIEPEHLFIGICSLEKYSDARSLEKLQISELDIHSTKHQIESLSLLFSNLGLEASTLRRGLRYDLAVRISKNFVRNDKAIHRSKKSRQVFAHAEKLAQESNSSPTTIFHLLIALLDDKAGSLAVWFHDTGVDIDKFKAETFSALKKTALTDNGNIVAQFISDEFEPPQKISEKELFNIQVRLINIAIQSQSQAMLERCLDEICRMFPQGNQFTLLFIEEGGEPVIRAGWPLINPQVSFTLVQKVVLSQTALHWVDGIDEAIGSLSDTAEALYAPILYGRKVLGVLQIAKSNSSGNPFVELDLLRLSVVANAIGLAIQASKSVPGSLPRYPWVFISYAHKDRDAVKRLVGDLRRRRIRVWIDEQLTGGEEWLKQLSIAIGQTDALLLFLSPDSVHSEYVLWEIKTALSANKKVIPVYYKTCEIPADLASLQYIDIRDDYAKGIYQLTQVLDTLII